MFIFKKNLVLKLWLPICTIFMFSFWRVQLSLYAPWLLALRRIPSFFPLEEMLGFEVGPRKAKETRKHLQMEIISILKIGQPDFVCFFFFKSGSRGVKALSGKSIEAVWTEEMWFTLWYENVFYLNQVSKDWSRSSFYWKPWSWRALWEPPLKFCSKATVLNFVWKSENGRRLVSEDTG